MERRRGDSYLGKDYSEPPGLPEDVHVSKKIVCVDCHETGPGGMGHIERKAGCQDCHIEVEQAMASSVHKNLVCAACHVKILGGYEMTSWGPGEIESKPNPFKKYSLYYGPQEPPILIRDQFGKWMPVKIWPNSMGGFNKTVTPVPGLIFRWPNGETHDAYAQLGTFSFEGGNNNYLAWLQVEEVAHPSRVQGGGSVVAFLAPPQRQGQRGQGAAAVPAVQVHRCHAQPSIARSHPRLCYHTPRGKSAPGAASRRACPRPSSTIRRCTRCG